MSPARLLAAAIAAAPLQAAAAGEDPVHATFLGNDSVSSSELEAVVGIGGGVSSWVLGPMDYDPSNLVADAERVRSHYRDAGFLDARVAPVPPSAFVIVEGRRYGYGSVGVAASIEQLSQGRLLASAGLSLTLGADFDAAEVGAAAESLSDEIASQGNPYADVEPQVTTDPASARADVTFVVREGPRAVVERVEVEGGAGVSEGKVLGAMATEEGKPFNATKAKGDERRLGEIDGLDRASVTPVPGSAPGSVVVKVTVEPSR